MEKNRSRALLLFASAGAAVGCLCMSLYYRNRYIMQRKSVKKAKSNVQDDKKQFDALLDFINGPVCKPFVTAYCTLYHFFHILTHRWTESNRKYADCFELRFQVCCVYAYLALGCGPLPVENMCLCVLIIKTLQGWFQNNIAKITATSSESRSLAVHVPVKVLHWHF